MPSCKNVSFCERKARENGTMRSSATLTLLILSHAVFSGLFCRRHKCESHTTIVQVLWRHMLSFLYFCPHHHWAFSFRFVPYTLLRFVKWLLLFYRHIFLIINIRLNCVSLFLVCYVSSVNTFVSNLWVNWKLN